MNMQIWLGSGGFVAWELFFNVFDSFGEVLEFGKAVFWVGLLIFIVGSFESNAMFYLVLFGMVLEGIVILWMWVLYEFV